MWVVGARSEWLSLGHFDDRGAEKRKATGEQDEGASKASPTSWTHPHSSSPTPHTRNDRKAVFPFFVSCFRFFRRDGMFHDGSVSAAVTHLVSCGGGYAGLPDACMCASLTAAVSWLACLVWHPDICTLRACQNLRACTPRSIAGGPKGEI